MRALASGRRTNADAHLAASRRSHLYREGRIPVPPVTRGSLYNTKHAIWVTTYGNERTRSGIIRAECFPAGNVHNIKSSDPYHGNWVLFEVKVDAQSCAVHSNLYTTERNVKIWAHVNQSGESITTVGQ